jgi:hypothetical protein
MKKILLITILFLISVNSFAVGRIARNSTLLNIELGFKVSSTYYSIVGCITPDHGITNYCAPEQLDSVGNSKFGFNNSTIPVNGKFEFFLNKNYGEIISYIPPTNFLYGHGAAVSKSGAKFLYGQVPSVQNLGGGSFRINFGYYGLSLISGSVSVQNNPSWINKFLFVYMDGYAVNTKEGYYDFVTNSVTINYIPLGKCGYIFADILTEVPYNYRLIGQMGIDWDLYGIITNSDKSQICI